MLAFEEALNPQQFQACTHSESPLLILAGAGSGKTRVITYRMAFLILTQGVPPHGLLAMTFTNKAAQEMRERVQALLAEAGVEVAPHEPYVGTFHATCVRILRRHAQRLGLSHAFSIYDDDDQRALLKTCAQRFGYPDDRRSIRSVQSYIDRCKNENCPPDEAKATAQTHRQQLFAQLYDVYNDALRLAQAVDFGDLIMLVNQLFERFPNVRERYAQRWQHVLVDEFQDTNHAQYRFLSQLVSSHQGVTVVGDDDQSIYAWRGADVRNMMTFERDFPTTHVVKLEQNYRSTQPILKLASDLIQVNTSRHDKRLWTDLSGGEPVTLHTALDERDEARFVSETLRLWRRKNPTASVGVLFRTNAQARVLEEQLRVDDVAYRLIGGVSFYSRAEVKDVLAFLKLVVNPADVVALRRIINVPTRGIGAKTVQRFDALVAAQFDGDIDAAFRHLLKAPTASLKGRARKALIGFYQHVQSWREATVDLLPSQMLERVLADTEYLEFVRQRDPDRADDRCANVGELLTAMREFERGLTLAEPTLAAFLEATTLNQRGEDGDIQAGAVELMTIHSAKGLEFDVVFVVGFEEALLPYQRPREIPNFEEERRLCYVAFTRARRGLFLSHVRRRRIHGTERTPGPSLFLDDLSVADLRRTRSDTLDDAPASRSFPNRRGHVQPAAPRRRPAATPRRDTSSADGMLQPGDIVIHDTFGVGEILERIERGSQPMVIVNFPMAGGQKKILSRFVKRL